MNVGDLLKKLKNINPNLKVMIDVTDDNSEGFLFSPIIEADVIETDQSEKMFVLSTHSYDDYPQFDEPSSN